MSGKKIKVALCLSGEPRNSMFCFPYIYESFINLGPEYEVDVYIHTRKTFRAFTLYNCTRYMLDHTTPYDILKSFHNISLPENLKTSKDFYLGFTTNSDFITNQLLMLDGIHKSFQLSFLDNKHYNIYIRCRPDMFTNYKIEINPIIKDLLNGKYDIFIPSKNFNPNSPAFYETLDQYNDQFAIGNFKGIEVYSNTLNNLEFLLNQTEEWKAENWLKAQLDYNNIKVKNMYLPIHLSREVKVQSNRGQHIFDMQYLSL
jgi:hypothetical protein